MWWSAVLGEIPSARATCLVWRPRASRPITSASRSVSPAGRSIRGAGCPAAASTARHGVGVEAPGTAFGESVSAALGGQRRAVGPGSIIAW